jgi:hypothetical protein
MKVRTSDVIGLGLLAFAAACRFKTPVADFYAERCYPVISSCLSRLAALVPFSLEEVVVIGFILVFIIVLVSSIARKEGFFRCLAKTGRVVMWLIVWFDLGWGCNYFRTPLYTRLEVEPIHYDSRAFERFLSEYTRDLNADAGSPVTWDRESLERDIKDYYATEGAACGYTPVRSWQHVKEPLINPLFSAVTVLGWMGPFFCETQVNLDLPELEYPSVLAHEMAHLAGVTGEGEANYWAYDFCRRSSNPSVRYSGSLGLFPYVAVNAQTLLPEEQYTAWLRSVPQRVKDDYADIQAFWDGKRVGIIEKAQRILQDLLLRSSGISEGTKDYHGVIGIIMTMDARHPRPPQKEERAAGGTQFAES